MKPEYNYLSHYSLYLYSIQYNNDYIESPAVIAFEGRRDRISIQEIQNIINQYIRCIKAHNKDEIKVAFNFY